jgi:hypothetical protein
MPVNNSLAVDIRAVEEEVGEDVVAVVDVVIIMRVVVEEAFAVDEEVEDVVDVVIIMVVGGGEVTGGEEEDGGDFNLIKMMINQNGLYITARNDAMAVVVLFSYST